ncbi:MAG: hypothetical protein JRH20_15495 [Deltaproteobacteria bacterium]|nr:hypothetical protein [Deltaproteobacteria bacterium]
MSKRLGASPPAHAVGVPTNVRLFLTLYGHENAKVAVALEQAGPLWISKGHRVPLKLHLAPHNARAYRNLYLVLEPQGVLKARRHYRLGFKSVRSFAGQTLTWWKRKLLGLRIKTASAPDETAPTKPQRLVSTGYALRRFGCGPAEAIGLRFQGSHDVKAARGGTLTKHLRLRFDVVEQVTGKKPRTLQIWSGPAAMEGTELGHGMCAGNFRLSRGARYRIQLRTIDWGGNISKPSAPVEVVAR